MQEITPDPTPDSLIYKIIHPRAVRSLVMVVQPVGLAKP